MHGGAAELLSGDNWATSSAASSNNPLGHPAIGSNPWDMGLTCSALGGGGGGACILWDVLWEPTNGDAGAYS